MFYKWPVVPVFSARQEQEGALSTVRNNELTVQSDRMHWSLILKIVADRRQDHPGSRAAGS